MGLESLPKNTLLVIKWKIHDVNLKKKILYKYLQVAIKLLHARETMSPAFTTLPQTVDLIEKRYHQ